MPGGADLVCYWFDKARAQIAAGALQRAGLVATNSIRGGANRKVLDAICAQTRIFDAWSDEPWVNDGAAVRVSLVAFGSAEQSALLDDTPVSVIYSDLHAAGQHANDLSTAQRLRTNAGVSFQGPVLVGDFEVAAETARQWLQTPNPHGRSNADVVRPLTNGKDITARSRGMWVVDFSAMPQADASLYEMPFEHVQQHVKPMRDSNARKARRENWWLHGRNWGRVAWSNKELTSVHRHITSVETPCLGLAKSVQSGHIKAVITIARADDTTFGILHSRFHELWSLRMCTWLEVGTGPRYTPTTCFETFPFPAGLTPADTAHQRTEAVEGGALIPADLPDTLSDALPTEDFKPNQPPAPVHQAPAAIKTIPPRQAATAIAQAAQRLNALRQAWLNPPEWTDTVPEVVPLGMSHVALPRPHRAQAGVRKELAKRTLTNLYNQRPAWLAAAHAQLDAAVAAAYGWADYTADMPDDEILRRLLALNLQRSTSEGA